MQILDENGNVDKKLMPDLKADQIKELYEIMVFTRALDDKMFKLQRAGKSGTWAQVLGQEAQCASAYALDKKDWAAPSFREAGIYVARGIDPVKIAQAAKGDTRAYENSQDTHTLPVCIPIATQCLHAVGLAWASKMRGEDEAAIAYMGDGGTSEGDFHEALNFAGVFKVPTIFFIQNNQWAISTPREIQTAADTIAQKSIAYGIHGVQIDGNDAFAVYKATKEALERGRKGEGPTLIEAMTFRMKDHTTSDDASKYRAEDAAKPWEKKDPILRLRLYMQKEKIWTDKDEQKLLEETEKKVKEAVDAAVAIEDAPPEDIFKWVYTNPIPEHIEQQKDLLEEVAEAKK